MKQSSAITPRIETKVIASNPNSHAAASFLKPNNSQAAVAITKSAIIAFDSFGDKSLRSKRVGKRIIGIAEYSNPEMHVFTLFLSLTSVPFAHPTSSELSPSMRKRSRSLFHTPTA
jgi:hypothetical protein